MRETPSYCTILPGDISTTNKIYSPNVHSIKGETVRRQPTPVVTGSIVIPPEVLNKHGDVTMAADIIQVKKLTFVLIMSLGLRFNGEPVLKP